MSSSDAPSPSYASLSSRELRSTLHAILEPRILLAEDEFARVASFSRRAVAIWSGIDRLEKTENFGAVSSTSSKELEDIKDALEAILDDDNEVLVLDVERDLSRLLQRHELDGNLRDKVHSGSHSLAGIASEGERMCCIQRMKRRLFGFRKGKHRAEHATAIMKRSEETCSAGAAAVPGGINTAAAAGAGREEADR